MGWTSHVVVDVALAIGLLVAGIHGSGDDYLVLDAAGGYLGLVTLLTDGSGGVWRLVPRLVHRVLDALVALALAASPVIVWRYGVHLDVFATAMAEAVAVILVRDAAVSDHSFARRPWGLRRTGPRPTARSGGGAPIDARAFEAGVSYAARKAGTVAGRATGRMARRSSAGRTGGHGGGGRTAP